MVNYSWSIDSLIPLVMMLLENFWPDVNKETSRLGWIVINFKELSKSYESKIWGQAEA